MRLSVHSITFNPFQENTYLITGSSADTIIIDPGCFDPTEREELTKIIEDHGLKPVRLINTHCHIDHVFGNAFIASKYNLGPEIHQGELAVLEAGLMVAGMYGIPYDPSPSPLRYIKENDEIELDGIVLRVLFVPGHSPASICFYNETDGWMISGDVLFYESIGRTDLPGGEYDLLLHGIRSKLFILPEDTVVYPGHGPRTTIGHEKRFNPYLQ